MVNYKSKYLAMKLKYINAKQKAGMNTTDPRDLVSSLIGMPLGMPQAAPDICANINAIQSNHIRFEECEKLKPQCEYKFNQCLKKGFAQFELNRDQLIIFTEIFENVHFDDPDIIEAKNEVGQLKKNLDDDTYNSAQKKLIYNRLLEVIRQYIHLVTNVIPVSTIMELLGIKTQYNENTGAFNIAIINKIIILVNEFKELDKKFDELLDQKNYLVLLQNYDRCKTITKTLALFCSINRELRSYCKDRNFDPNRMYDDLFNKNNIYSRKPPEDEEDFNMEDVLVFGSDLSHLDLSNLDLSGFTFGYTNFEHATLIGTNFTNANFSYVKFDHAILTNAKLDNIQVFDTSFVDANLINATLINAFLEDTQFNNAKLNNADFSDSASEGGVTFYGANLTDAKFINAGLVRARFGQVSEIFGENEGANLTNTNFTRAFMNFSDFSNTNLSTANFKDAQVQAITLKKTIYNPLPSKSPFKDAQSFSEN